MTRGPDGVELSPSRRTGYLSFGYLPSGDLRADLRARVLGAPNVLKRLQAADVLDALDLQPGQQVLDLGCGSGYFTVEIAKHVSGAVGVDVNPYVDTIRVPAALAGRLRYLQTDGEPLPFPGQHFDRILASEVLPMLEDPAGLLEEAHRLLKPDGRLVVVNGVGHPVIRQAYRTDSRRLRRLRRRHQGRMPDSYEEYEAALQRLFGTARTRFLTEEEVVAAVRTAGFRVERVGHSPRAVAGNWLSWRQFQLFLRTGSALSSRRFLPRFALLSLLSLLDRRDYPGGLVIVASRA